MAIKVLDDSGLSYFFNKIKSRLLPRVSASDSGKIAKVDSSGSWELASSSEFKGDTGVGFASGTVDGNYHLILTKTDGTTSDAGYVRGSQGEPGTTGVGVSSATVNSSGHLVFTKTDSNTTDAGDIVTTVLNALSAAEDGSY